MSTAMAVLSVVECQGCGAWLDDDDDAVLCKDCALRDCVFCGRAVPRMDLSHELACPMCRGEEP